jgi:putative CocE/NonD family hydrolase
VLVYTTDVLDTALEIIGRPRVVLYVQSSSKYTDFFGRICVVHPDGRSINICDGLQRLEPGSGERQPDGTLRIILTLSPTAYCFEAGERLRLQVSSGAHPRFARNLGSDEPYLMGTKLIIQHQTVYHDADHPSALILPQL